MGSECRTFFSTGEGNAAMGRRHAPRVSSGQNASHRDACAHHSRSGRGVGRNLGNFATLHGGTLSPASPGSVHAVCDSGNVRNLFPPPEQAEARTELRKRLRTAEILRSLLDAAVAYSRDCGTRHWYIFTTRALAKVLGYVLPLQLQQVGEPVWHRGERYPFLVSIEHLLGKVVHAGMGHYALERHPAFHRYSELMTATMARAVGAV